MIFDQESDNWSIFAQGTYDILDTLRITGGVRYSEDDKRATSSTLYSSDFTGGIGLENYPGPNQVLEDMWLVLGGTDDYIFPEQGRKEHHLTPAVKLEWDATSDTLVYLSYAEGYKSGGFSASDGNQVLDPNPSGPSAVPGDSFEYLDEAASTWELGAKMEFPAASARLSAAVFTTEYQDLQVTSFTGTSFAVSNAASATINGFELDGEWAPSDELVIGASAAYLDYSYDEYANASCTAAQTVAAAGGPCTQDLRGQTGIVAPEFSGTAYFDYDRPVTQSLKINFGADVYYTGEHFLSPDNDPMDANDASTKVDVRLGIGDLDGRWKFTLFGRNITDVQTYSTATDISLLPGGHFAYVNRGAEWGGRLKLNF